MPTAQQIVDRAASFLAEVQGTAGGVLSEDQFKPLTDVGVHDVKYAYYRKPDGRVTLYQYGANAVDLPLQGWTLLHQFGAIDPPRNAASDGPIGDPYGAIVRRPGGLAVFPAEQVLELGWHRRPGPAAKGSQRHIWSLIQAEMAQGADQTEAVRRVFPQLRDVTWQDIACGLCPNRWFLSEDQRHKHELIAHAEDARTRELRDSITAALERGGRQDNSVVEALVKVMEQGQAAQHEDREQTRELLLLLLQALGGTDKKK